MAPCPRFVQSHLSLPAQCAKSHRAETRIPPIPSSIRLVSRSDILRIKLSLCTLVCASCSFCDFLQRPQRIHLDLVVASNTSAMQHGNNHGRVVPLCILPPINHCACASEPLACTRTGSSQDEK